MTADLDALTAAGLAYGDARAAEAILPLQAANRALSVMVADLQAELARQQPTTIYGASGGRSQAASIALLKPRLLRTYQPDQQANAPRDMPQLYSAQPDLVKLAAKDPLTVTSLVGTFAVLSDIAGHYVCIGHETDNNRSPEPVIPVAVYQAAWVVFLLVVIPQVNAGRANKVRTVAIDTGSADHAQWYVPGADVIGSDVYSTRAVRDLAAFAAFKRRPFGIAEWGFGVKGVVAADEAFHARVVSDSAAWKGAEFVLLYDSRSNSLVDHPRPLTVAAWHQLTATGAL